VELDDIQIVGLQALQALFDSGNDIASGEDVRLPASGAHGCMGSNDTAALGGQDVLGTPSAEIAADALFAEAIVNRRVHVIDAAVQNCLKDGFRLGFVDRRAARRVAEFHGPVAELRHLEPSAAQRAHGQILHGCHCYLRSDDCKTGAAMPARLRRYRDGA
jgi:hypothetical protein